MQVHSSCCATAGMRNDATEVDHHVRTLPAEQTLTHACVHPAAPLARTQGPPSQGAGAASPQDSASGNSPFWANEAAADVHSWEVQLVLEYCDLGTLRDALNRGLFALPGVRRGEREGGEHGGTCGSRGKEGSEQGGRGVASAAMLGGLSAEDQLPGCVVPQTALVGPRKLTCDHTSATSPCLPPCCRWRQGLCRGAGHSSGHCAGHAAPAPRSHPP